MEWAFYGFEMVALFPPRCTRIANKPITKILTNLGLNLKNLALLLAVLHECNSLSASSASRKRLSSFR